MSEIVDELTVDDGPVPLFDDALCHYGTKYHSGRYPWGSGKNSYQHSDDFLSRVEDLRKSGLSDNEIIETMGMYSSTEFRIQEKAAKHIRRMQEAERARSLREDGLSLQQIADEMGYPNDSSVRSLLNKDTSALKSRGLATADILQKMADEKGMIDVGKGAELSLLGVSSPVMEEALFILHTRGYETYKQQFKNLTNIDYKTTYEILIPPTMKPEDIYNNPDKINSVGEFHSKDGGLTFAPMAYPESLDSKRIKINYREEGGIDKDGLIEIRPGIDDISLGDQHYAQVRILVDGTHYMKGMAIYNPDLPDGVDVVFNTNKSKGTPACGPKGDTVLKPIKKDNPNDPFGASITASGQSYYIGKDGKEHLSVINKIKGEGKWNEMDRNLSSQFLSKQPLKLAKQQLDIDYKSRLAEFENINSLTNGVVKRKLMKDFADNCDSAAWEMKAAALPRQRTQVLIPIPSLKDNEVYAPNYKNGEKIALVRYPHGGIFEIPVLTVNNRNREGSKIITNLAQDAVGINAKVAEQLSGADFDGDQVVCIPTGNGKVKINSQKPLADLQGFDPKVSYAIPAGNPNHVKIMKEENKQGQMGEISNLITDMTLGGADEHELARAIKHSMVVIDAVKHELDYKQSEIDNGIPALRKKYQQGSKGHATTLIARHKQTVDVQKRAGTPRIDPDTGEYIYKTVEEHYIDKKTGKDRIRTTAAKVVLEVDDVHELSTGTKMEDLYADYANQMKALANQARKQYMWSRKNEKVSKDPEAAKKYADVIEGLEAKRMLAEKNRPKERIAQARATSRYHAILNANPDIDKKHRKKYRQTLLDDARREVGLNSEDKKIRLTPLEWEAIQAHAVSDTRADMYFQYVDDDQLREYSTPAPPKTLPASKINRINSLANMGYTNAEIAEAVGYSVSTVSEYIK